MNIQSWLKAMLKGLFPKGSIVIPDSVSHSASLFSLCIGSLTVWPYCRALQWAGWAFYVPRPICFSQTVSWLCHLFPASLHAAPLPPAANWQQATVFSGIRDISEHTPHCPLLDEVLAVYALLCHVTWPFHTTRKSEQFVYPVNTEVGAKFPPGINKIQFNSALPSICDLWPVFNVFYCRSFVCLSFLCKLPWKPMEVGLVG